MKDGNVMSNDNMDNPNYTPLTIHAVERWEEEQRRRTARYNNQNGFNPNKEVNGNQMPRNNNQNHNPNKNKKNFKNKNKVANPNQSVAPAVATVAELPVAPVVIAEKVVSE